MAENALVDADIEYGARVLRALDDAGDPSMRPTAAFWFLFDEENVWRLLLAVPGMQTIRPRSSTDALSTS